MNFRRGYCVEPTIIRSTNIVDAAPNSQWRMVKVLLTLAAAVVAGVLICFSSVPIDQAMKEEVSITTQMRNITHVNTKLMPLRSETLLTSTKHYSRQHEAYAANERKVLIPEAEQPIRIPDSHWKAMATGLQEYPGPTSFIRRPTPIVLPTPPPAPSQRGPPAGKKWNVKPQKISPDDPEWSNSIAICVAIKNENYTDFREFVNYHRWAGFDHIYVTENNSKYPIGKYLQDFVEDGFLTYAQRNEGGAQQVVIYKICDMHHRHEYNWMMYMDADEFLQVRARGKTLKGVLDEYKHEAGLSVHWQQHGPSGRMKRPEQGGILRTYTKCEKRTISVVKTIVNNYYIDTVLNPHNQMYKDGREAVNTDRTPLEPRRPDPNARQRSTHIEVRLGKKSLNVLSLHHFVTKSREDFEIKLARGPGGGGPTRTWEGYRRIAAADEDLPQCKELADIADKCCSREREREIALKYDFKGITERAHAAQ